MSKCELEHARGENFRPPAAASTAQQLLKLVRLKMSKDLCKTYPKRGSDFFDIFSTRCTRSTASCVRHDTARSQVGKVPLCISFDHIDVDPAIHTSKT